MWDLEQGNDKSNPTLSIKRVESDSSTLTLTPTPAQPTNVEIDNQHIPIQRGVLGTYLSALIAITRPPPPDHSVQIRNKTEKSRYTSRSFHDLPKPMPVLKGISRHLLLQIMFVPFVYSLNLVTLSKNILIIQTVLWVFLRVFGIRLWDVKQPWSLEMRWPQDLWEDFGHSFLKSNKGAVRFWWAVYLIVARSSDFEQNYLAAYMAGTVRKIDSHLPRSRIRIFLDHEEMLMPLPSDDDDDKAIIETLVTMYSLLKIRRGIYELLLPKKLTVPYLGERIRTLDLGRDRRHADALPAFHNHSMASHRKALVEDFHTLPDDEGVEFVRALDHVAITWVVLFPPIASLIFAVVWISVFIHRENADTQEIVGTASTVSSYLVTTGALIIAFIAYFEDKVMNAVDEKGQTKR